MGIDLAGKKLGLVGLGRIGSRVATVAQALQMSVLAFDPFVSPETARARGVELMADLPSLLRAADIVSLHVPLTTENRGLIGAGELALMKRGAMLINAARGPIVVPEALFAALRSGHLAGAALDVWDPGTDRRRQPLAQAGQRRRSPRTSRRQRSRAGCATMWAPFAAPSRCSRANARRVSSTRKSGSVAGSRVHPFRWSLRIALPVCVTGSWRCSSSRSRSIISIAAISP